MYFHTINSNSSYQLNRLFAMQPNFGANLLAPPFDSKLPGKLLQLRLNGIHTSSISIVDVQFQGITNFCGILQLPETFSPTLSVIETISKTCKQLGASCVIIGLPKPKSENFLTSIIKLAAGIFISSANTQSNTIETIFEWQRHFEKEHFHVHEDLPLPVLLLTYKDCMKLKETKLRDPSVHCFVEPYKKEKLIDLLRTALHKEDSDVRLLTIDDERTRKVLQYLDIKNNHLYEVDVQECCNLFAKQKSDDFYVYLIFALQLETFLTEKKVSLNFSNSYLFDTIWNLLGRIRDGSWNRSLKIKLTKSVMLLIEFLELVLKHYQLISPYIRETFGFCDLVHTYRFINYMNSDRHNCSYLKALIDDRCKPSLLLFLRGLVQDNKIVFPLFEKDLHEVNCILEQCIPKLQKFEELTELISFAKLFEISTNGFTSNFIGACVQKCLTCADLCSICDKSKNLIAPEELVIICNPHIYDKFTPSELLKWVNSSYYGALGFPSNEDIIKYITSDTLVAKANNTALSDCLELLLMLTKSNPEDVMERTVEKFFNVMIGDTISMTGNCSCVNSYGCWRFLSMANHEIIVRYSKIFVSVAKSKMTFDEHRTKKIEQLVDTLEQVKIPVDTLPKDMLHEIVGITAEKLVKPLRLSDKNHGLFYKFEANSTSKLFWIECSCRIATANNLMNPIPDLKSLVYNLTSWGVFDDSESSVLFSWLIFVRSLKNNKGTYAIDSPAYGYFNVLLETFEKLFSQEVLETSIKVTLDELMQYRTTISIFATVAGNRTWLIRLKLVMDKIPKKLKLIHDSVTKITRLQHWVPNLVAVLENETNLSAFGSELELQMNVTQLQITQNVIMDWLRNIDTSNDTLLNHFLLDGGGSKSILFKFFLNEEKSKQPRKEWVDVQSFNLSLEIVKQKFEQLLEMKVSFDELLTVGQVLRSHAQSVEAEIDFICEFFSDRKHKTISYESLNTVLTLYSLKEPLKNFIGCKNECKSILHQFKFSCAKNASDNCFLRLEAITTELCDHSISSKWKYKECKTLLQEIITLLVPSSNINSTEEKLEKLNGLFSLFSHLGKSVKVWEFFHSHPSYVSNLGIGYSGVFKEKVEDFLSQLSGDDYKLLCIFDDAAKWISIMVHNQAEPQLRILLEKMLNSGPIINHIFSCKRQNIRPFSSLITVEDNMDFFHQLFLKGLGGLDAVVGQFKSISKFCTYIFELSHYRFNIHLSFYDEAKDRCYDLDSEDVLDLELRLGFIQKEDKLKSLDIDAYLKWLQLLRGSMPLIYDLYIMGNNQWKATRILLPIGERPLNIKWVDHEAKLEESSISITKKMIVSLNTTMSAWSETLDSVIASNKILCLYSPSVAQRLADIIQIGSVPDIVLVVSQLFCGDLNDFEKISSYVSACLKSLQQVTPDWTSISASFLDKLMKYTELSKLTTTQNSMLGPYYYQLKFGHSSILKALCHIFRNECSPQSYQIYWCDSYCTSQSIEAFLKRAVHFPAIPFVLVNINLLKQAVQQDCLSYLVEARRRNGNCINVNEAKNLCFLDLGSSIVKSVAWMTFAGDEDFISLDHNSLLHDWCHCDNRIKSVECYCGASGMGKSYQIKNRLLTASSTISLNLSITEGFSRSDFVQKIKQILLDANSQPITLAFQFNIGKFKEKDILKWNELRDEINQFFCCLILLQTVEDTSAGVLFKIPVRSELTLLIEVPDSQGNFEKHGNFSVLNEFPLLAAIGTVHNVESFPFDVSTEANHVAKYLKAYETGDIDQLYTCGNVVKDIVFVLDQSGSMEDRIGTCKSCLLQDIFPNRLTVKDRVGFLAFDHVINVNIPIAAFNSNHKDRIISSLNSLQTRGGTEMWSCLEVAIGMLSSLQSSSKWIVALTDGASGGQPSQVHSLLRINADINILFITIGLESTYGDIIRRTCIRSDNDLLLSVDSDLEAISNAWQTIGDRLTVSQKIEKEGESLSEEECVKVLQNAMDRNWSRLKQKQWIRYMYRRCGILASSEKFNKNQTFHKFGSTTMAVMLEEADLALNEDYRIDWQHQNHEQLVYSKTRSTDKDGNQALDYRWSIIATNPDDVSDSGWRNRVELLKSLKMLIPTKDDINRADRRVLDSYLAHGLEIELTDTRVDRSTRGEVFDFELGTLPIINDKKFVLTLEFVMKLLCINERIESGVPCIMEGETGVSKTAITRMLFILKNCAFSKKTNSPFVKAIGNCEAEDQLDGNLELEAYRRIAEFWILDIWNLHSLFEKDVWSNSEKLCKIICHENSELVIEALLEELRAAPELDPMANSELVFTESDIQHRTGLFSKEEIHHLLQWFVGHQIAKRDCSDRRKEEHWTFFTIDIHAALTPSYIAEVVGTIVERAERLSKLGNWLKSEVHKHIKLCIFFDEVNTSPYMGVFKELLIDHSLNGVTLPSNLITIAACNPCRDKIQVSGDRREELGNEWAMGHYQVHSLPTSMRQMTWAYGSMSSSQEYEFICKKLFFIKEKEKIPQQEVNELANLLQFSQDLTREFAKQHIKAILEEKQLTADEEEIGTRASASVSLRDILRVFDLFSFFRDTKHPVIVRNAFLGRGFDDEVDNLRRRSMVLAIAIVYYLRLGSDPYNPDNDYRTKFRNKIRGNFGNQMDIAAVLNTCTLNIIEHIQLEDGVAGTTGLHENIVMIIICCLARCPLMIIGPPGSSKTLAVTIVAENARGEYSKSDFFKAIPALMPFRYQCSRRSTSLEIEAVFKRAIDRQHKANIEKSNLQCFVFMDEAGLPEDGRESLKILHYYLENHNHVSAKVSFVAISNHLLDAAKSNRCVLLSRAKPDIIELMNVARGCFGSDSERRSFISTVHGYHSDGSIGRLELDPFDPNHPGILRLLSETYDACMSEQRRFRQFSGDRPPPKDFVTFFGLRDFMHFVKLLHRLARYNRFKITRSMIVEALSRNFNGVDPSHLREIVEYFMIPFPNSECKSSIGENSIVLRNPFYLLKDSLGECTAGAGPVNRYKMIIDTTLDDSILRALKYALASLCGKNSASNGGVLKLSNFPEESLHEQIKFVSQVKWMAEKGQMALLSQIAPVNECFYDLFNQNFRKFVDTTESGSTVVYHADIAVGAHSRRCRILEEFVCIVHITMAELQVAPAPYLNRFEKYRITHVNLVDAIVNSSLAIQDIIPLKRVLENSKLISHLYNFIDCVGPMTLFGFAEEQTIESCLSKLILSWQSADTIVHKLCSLCHNSLFCEALQLELDKMSCVVDISALKAPDFIERLLYGPDSDSHIGMALVGQAIMHIIVMENLLKVSLTDQLLYQATNLPKAILNEFLQDRSRFSFLSLLDTFSISKNKKNMVFTRTSSDLISATTNSTEQQTSNGVKFRIDMFSKFLRESAFNDKIGAFYSNSDTADLYVLVIDGSTTPSSQINYVRHKVDEIIGTENTEKSIVLLLHFAPSDLLLGAHYQTTFTGDWNAVYLEGMNDSAVPEWIQFGYGINSSEPSLSATFPTILEAWFPDALEQAISSITVSAEYTSWMKAQKIYVTKDKSVLQNFLISVLYSSIDGVTPVNVITDAFFKAWSDGGAKLHLLKEYIQQKVKDVALGECRLSLQDAIVEGVRTSLVKMIVDFCSKLLSDTNNAIISELTYDNSSANATSEINMWLAEYWLTNMRSMSILPMSELVGPLKPVYVVCNKLVPSWLEKFPFYLSLAHTIHTSTVYALGVYARYEEDDVWDKVADESYQQISIKIEGNECLQASISCILVTDSLPQGVWQRYLGNFVYYFFQEDGDKKFEGERSLNFQLVYRWLDTHPVITMSKKKICALHAIAYWHRETLLQLVQLVLPIKHFSDIVIDDTNSIIDEISDDSSSVQLTSWVIHSVFKKVVALVTSTSPTAEEFLEIFSVIKQFSLLRLVKMYCTRCNNDYMAVKELQALNIVEMVLSRADGLDTMQMCNVIADLCRSTETESQQVTLINYEDATKAISPIIQNCESTEENMILPLLQQWSSIVHLLKSDKLLNETTYSRQVKQIILTYVTEMHLSLHQRSSVLMHLLFWDSSNIKQSQAAFNTNVASARTAIGKLNNSALSILEETIWKRCEGSKFEYFPYWHTTPNMDRAKFYVEDGLFAVCLNLATRFHGNDPLDKLYTEIKQLKTPQTSGLSTIVSKIILSAMFVLVIDWLATVLIKQYTENAGNGAQIFSESETEFLLGIFDEMFTSSSAASDVWLTELALTIYANNKHAIATPASKALRDPIKTTSAILKHFSKENFISSKIIVSWMTTACKIWTDGCSRGKLYQIGRLRLRDTKDFGRILKVFDVTSQAASQHRSSFFHVYMQRRHKLRLLWVLPDVIEFYSWLAKEFSSFDLDIKQVSNLTIQSIIDNLQHTDDSHEKLKLWVRVKVGVGFFVNTFSALKLTAVDEATPLVNVVSLQKDSAVDDSCYDDLLFNIIKEMIDYYNDFLNYVKMPGIPFYELDSDRTMKNRPLQDFTGVHGMTIQQPNDISASSYDVEQLTVDFKESIQNQLDVLEFYSPLSDLLTQRAEITVLTTPTELDFCTIKFNLKGLDLFASQLQQTLIRFHEAKYYKKICRFGGLDAIEDKTLSSTVKIYLPIFHSQELIYMQKLIELVNFVIEYVKLRMPSSSAEEEEDTMDNSISTVFGDSCRAEDVLKEIYSDVHSHLLAPCFQNDDQFVAFLNIELHELTDFKSYLTHMISTESYLFAHKKYELKLQWPDEVEAELLTLLDSHKESPTAVDKVKSLEFHLAKYEQIISLSPEKPLLECLRAAFLSDNKIFEQIPLLQELLAVENSFSVKSKNPDFAFTGQYYVTLRIKIRLWLKTHTRTVSKKLHSWDWPFLNGKAMVSKTRHIDEKSSWRARITPWFLRNTENVAENEKQKELSNALLVKIVTRKICKCIEQYAIRKKKEKQTAINVNQSVVNFNGGGRGNRGGRSNSGRGSRGGRGRVLDNDNKKNKENSLAKALQRSLIEKDIVESQKADVLMKLQHLQSLPPKVESLPQELQAAIEFAVHLGLENHQTVRTSIELIETVSQQRDRALTDVENLITNEEFVVEGVEKAIRSALDVGCSSSTKTLIDASETVALFKKVKDVLECKVFPELSTLKLMHDQIQGNFKDLKQPFTEMMKLREQEEATFLEKCESLWGAEVKSVIIFSILNWASRTDETSLDESIPPFSVGLDEGTSAVQLLDLLKYKEDGSSMRKAVSAALDLLDGSLQTWIHKSVYQAVSSSTYTHRKLCHSDIEEDMQKYCNSISSGDISQIVPAILLVAARQFDDDVAFQRSCLRRCAKFGELKSIMSPLELAIAVSPFTKQPDQITQANKTATHLERWDKLKNSQHAKPSPAIDEIMKYVGLASVKDKVLKMYNTLLKEASMPPEKVHPRPHNFVFLGNPGTGKTTIAKLIGQMLGDIGLRKKDIFVQTSGEELLRMGATKAAQLLDNAKGGTVFIDEAHKLDPENNRAEGVAIASQLLKITDEGKLETSVILAGYKNDIDEKLISYDDGFRSRFENGVIIFEDFTEEEIAEIFRKKCRDKNWAPASEDVVHVAAKRVARGRGRKGFGNARVVEKLVELAYERALEREDTSEYVITIEDIIGPRPDRSQYPELDKALNDLDNLIGLASVKKSVFDLVNMAITNYDREILGQDPFLVPLNRVFLGNPGTGKTSVAKLYGKILKCLGFLSKSGYELLKASDFIGDAVGVTQTKTAKILQRCEGKIMIIDEAYSLTNSQYGQEAIDEIVATIHGSPDEDICCVMIGYEKQMKKMFRNCNPGLTGRFDLKNAIVFEDFSDDELENILLSKLDEFKLTVSRYDRQKVVAAISQQRYLPNFRNAGVVVNTLSHAKTALSLRDPYSTKLILEDFGISDGAQSKKSWRDTLAHMSKIDHIREEFEGLEALIKQVEKDKGNIRQHLKNYVFVGKPGTGKTEMAKIYSKMLQEMNLVNSTFVICSALELQANYSGQTKDKVNELIDSAVGGVLFIDEAYRLEGDRGFEKDACDQLVARTEPSDLTKPVVILAGYKEQMDRMFSKSNPGLRGRFTNEISFPDWGATDCVSFIQRQCKKDHFQISQDTHSFLKTSIHELIHRPAWSNARDCWTIYRDMYAARALRVSKIEERERTYTVDDVKKVIAQLLNTRPHPVATEIAEDPLNILFMTDQAKNHGLVSRQKVLTNAIDTAEVQIAFDGDGESPEFAALLLACVEAGYDSSHEKRKELVKLLDAVYNFGSGFPDDILQLVVAKTGKSESQLTTMLRPQVPIVLEGMNNAVAAEEQRLQQLKAIKDAEERRKQEMEMQAKAEKLRVMGRCVAGFSWHRCGNGWRCAGGSHYCSDAELNFV